MEIEPPEELTKPWAHQSPEMLNPDAAVLQLIVLRSFGPRVSWTVFDSPDRSFRIRRLQAPPGQRIRPLVVFGAEGRMSRSEMDPLLSTAGSIEFPKSDRATDVLDGSTRLVRFLQRPHLEDRSWSESSEFEELSLWFDRTIELLDRTLPAYPDPGWSA